MSLISWADKVRGKRKTRRAEKIIRLVLIIFYFFV
jgi:hypothetical protein